MARTLYGKAENGGLAILSRVFLTQPDKAAAGISDTLKIELLQGGFTAFTDADDISIKTEISGSDQNHEICKINSSASFKSDLHERQEQIQ